MAGALIVGVMGWRWALVAATTEYGPAPDSVGAEPATRPHAKRSPPPIDVEVTVLDVHTAPAPRAARAPAKALAPAASSRPMHPGKSTR